MKLGRPVTLRGLPMRRPTPSPYTPLSFESIANVMEELRQMHMDFVVGVPLVEQALAAFEAIKQGPQGPMGMPGRPGLDGKNVTMAEVEAAVRKYLRQPKDGIAPTVEEVADAVLSSPKLFKFIKRKLKRISENVGTIAQQADVQEDVPAETILAMVLEGVAKTGLPMTNIKGLQEKLDDMQRHIRASANWRGGGDTVVAGAGIAITNTVNGNKQITATGTSAGWKTPPETPDGVNLIFSVDTEPTEVVADGATFFDGAGYTYTLGQITFVNPPTQYVRYQ